MAKDLLLIKDVYFVMVWVILEKENIGAIDAINFLLPIEYIKGIIIKKYVIIA